MDLDFPSFFTNVLFRLLHSIQENPCFLDLLWSVMVPQSFLNFHEFNSTEEYFAEYPSVWVCLVFFLMIRLGRLGLWLFITIEVPFASCHMEEDMILTELLTDDVSHDHLVKLVSVFLNCEVTISPFPYSLL